MPFLPISQKLFANVDDIGNTVAVSKRIDIVKDDLQNNVPRFRLAVFAELGINAIIDGEWRLKRQDFAAVVAGGKLFKVESDSTVTEITITSGALKAGTRAFMADFGDVAYFCNNSHIIRWDLSTLTAAAIVDPDAPIDATHIGFFDQYLLAKRANSERWEWSDVGLPDVWLGEFAKAAARPDLLAGLYTAFGEIFLPGTETLEYWSDLGDAVTPFGRLAGTMTERGVLAPDSVALVDNTYFFLDQEARVIRLEGRAPKVVSNDIDKIIQAMAKDSTVTDAIGFGMTGAGQTLYILTFPTAGQTWAYNYKLDEWTEFSWWNDVTGKREAFLGSSAVHFPTWGKTILGSRKADGKLYYATFDQKTDAGAPMRSELVTGRIDWKAPTVKKRCKLLMLEIKRGTSGLEGDDSLFIQFRDDGATQYGTPIEVKLGKAGDQYSFVPITRLGRYKSRQWRFLLPSVDTVLVSAEETLEGA